MQAFGTFNLEIQNISREDAEHLEGRLQYKGYKARLLSPPAPPPPPRSRVRTRRVPKDGEATPALNSSQAICLHLVDSLPGGTINELRERVYKPYLDVYNAGKKRAMKHETIGPTIQKLFIDGRIRRSGVKGRYRYWPPNHEQGTLYVLES